MNKLEFRKGEYADAISVYNEKREFLGLIFYYPTWKKFVWEQEEDMLMSKDCLRQIIDYMVKREIGGKP